MCKKVQKGGTMSEKRFFSIFYFLSIMIFCSNIVIGVIICNWILEKGDIVIAGMWAIITFMFSGIMSMKVLSEMYDLIEIDEKKVIK